MSPKVVVKRRRKGSLKDIDRSDTLRIKHERKPACCEMCEWIDYPPLATHLLWFFFVCVTKLVYKLLIFVLDYGKSIWDNCSV